MIIRNRPESSMLRTTIFPLVRSSGPGDAGFWKGMGQEPDRRGRTLHRADDRCIYGQPAGLYMAKPMEEKTFTQYFMPYKAVGAVKNASIHAVINLDVEEEGIRVAAYGDTGVPRMRPLFLLIIMNTVR